MPLLSGGRVFSILIAHHCADNQMLDPIVPVIKNLVLDLRGDMYRIALSYIIHLPIDLHPPLAAEKIVDLLGRLVIVIIALQAALQTVHGQTGETFKHASIFVDSLAVFGAKKRPDQLGVVADNRPDVPPIANMQNNLLVVSLSC